MADVQLKFRVDLIDNTKVLVIEGTDGKRTAHIGIDLAGALDLGMQLNVADKAIRQTLAQEG